MTFEQQVNELVSKGDYVEVSRMTTADFCPLATKMQSETLVRKAASNLIARIEMHARESDEFPSFVGSVDKLVELAKSGAFPQRTRAGEAAIKLYSERMATDQIKRLSGSSRVPKSVASRARQELKTCELDSDFLSTRTYRGRRTFDVRKQPQTGTAKRAFVR